MGKPPGSQGFRQCSAATGAVPWGRAEPGALRSTQPWQHSLDHLGNGDLGVLLEGIHHEAVAADVVHALEET